MPDTHINRVKQAVTGTPGTGTITLGAAAAGFRALGASQNGLTFSCLFLDGTAWEIATGCTYTHSGTTLTRGTREDSSTGAAISLTSAATVSVIAAASSGTAWDARSADATVLARANHTGTQLAATISDFGAGVRSATLSGVETPLADSTIIDGDSVLTGFRKLISRCANALNRANHTGTQAISTVTGLQAALDAKSPKPSQVAPTGAVTITAANDNTTYDTVSTSRAFTVSAGISANFSGVTVDGPCTWAAAGGVTITDSRASGAGYHHCTLVPVAFNKYRLVGVTA